MPLRHPPEPLVPPPRQPVRQWDRRDRREHRVARVHQVHRLCRRCRGEELPVREDGPAAGHLQGLRQCLLWHHLHRGAREDRRETACWDLRALVPA